MVNPIQAAALLSICPTGWLTGKISIVSGDLFEKAHAVPFACDSPILLIMGSSSGLENISEILQIIYPLTFPIKVKNFGSDELIDTTLTRVNTHQDVEALFLPALDELGSSESFQEIVAHLRAPDGCPWDREQTHQSLRPFLLEESYEMLDAMDRGDLQEMKKELGDVLLQIYLHAQIASERGDFSMRDILSAISQKMVRRHPHVFADVIVNGDVGQVLRNWQDIKEDERRTNGEPETRGILDGVPNSMSALLQAQTFQGRAAAVGFDWDSIEGVLKKVEEEIVEVRQAASPAERAGEVGDLFFALVNLARWLKLDAESELRTANQKFARRFAFVEKKARESGRSVHELSFMEMDQYWDEAKQNGM